ncbi:nitrate- and nitrite sensing domain-containing protein, partial [Nonomuraea rhizosphaerae]|uniref:nitrate- and nitrite sensing domain-containing protein n=1 Tax=Nonomuraea rhizosphaerae TaxID=2665663 RepID=UPI001C5CC8C8
MASGRSIRFKISTLLILPLVSLVGLWGFAVSITSGEALNILKVNNMWTGVITHADFLVYSIQQERLVSAEVVAGTAPDPAALAAARGKVDEVKQRLVTNGWSADSRRVLTDEMESRLRNLLAAADKLPEIRRQVDSRALTPTSLITEYSGVADAA